MVSEIKSFKDKKGKVYPILSLKKDENTKWAFTFGLAKAKLIVQHFQDIENFVRDYDKPVKADLE